MLLELLFLFVLFYVALFLGFLDSWGSTFAFSMGIIILVYSGFSYVLLLVLSFLLGSLVSTKHTKRGWGNVLANGAIPLLFAVMQSPILYTGAISAYISDTLASEIGTKYGKSFYDIISLKKTKKGIDGAVSVVGLLAGFAGSLTIGILAYLLGILPLSSALIFSVLFGNFANIIDSYIGATLQRMGYVSNSQTNLLAIYLVCLVSLLWI